MTKFPKLAGLAEIAGLAGVSRQRAAQLASHSDFPQPVDRLAMGPVWRESDVQKFLATPRKPGRRPKTCKQGHSGQPWVHVRGQVCPGCGTTPGSRRNSDS